MPLRPYAAMEAVCFCLARRAVCPSRLLFRAIYIFFASLRKNTVQISMKFVGQIQRRRHYMTMHLSLAL